MADEVAWQARIDWAKALLKWFDEEAIAVLQRRCAPEFLAQVRAQAESLKQSLASEHRTEIAFLGSTTVGKSTTINAVIGRRILPENRIGSTTAAKVILRFGARERLTVKFVTEAWLRDEFAALLADWRAVIQEEELTGQQAEGDTMTSIERRRSIARSALGLPLNHQLRIEEVDFDRVPSEIRAALGSERDFESDLTERLAEHVAGRFAALVDEAVVALPDPVLEDGLVLVDLPGTGDLDEGRIRSLRAYIDRADQILLVLSIQLLTTDVHGLIVNSDLLTRLQNHKRPLVVVGTKIDTSNPPTPEQLAQFGLLGSLEGLRAIEAMWQAKAEAELFRLLARHVDKTHPRGQEEPEEEYRSRVLAQFGECAIVPVNPRAYLDMDPRSRAPHTTDADIASWQSKYPQEGDTGIKELRERLRGIAIAGKVDAQARLARELDHFFGTVNALLSAPASADVAETSSGFEVGYRRAEKESVERFVTLEARLGESKSRAISGIRAILSSAIAESAEKRAAQVTQHLRDKHHSSVKASMRDPRNGVWNTIHVPNALFDQTRQRALEVWREFVASLNEVALGVTQESGEFNSRVEQLIRKELGTAAPVALSSLEAHRRSLAARLEGGVREVDSELSRVTGALSDQTELTARRALRPAAGRAAEFKGPGTSKRIIELLAVESPVVARTVLLEVEGGFVTEIERASERFKSVVLDAARAANRSLEKDLRRALEAVGASALGDDGVDRALRHMPRPGEPEPLDSEQLVSSVPDFTPFLIGSNLVSQEDVYWDPMSVDRPLNNFGVFISGDSGTGKTQLIRAMIAAMSSANIPVWIFDFKNDFSDPTFVEANQLEVVNVNRQGLPFNPLALVDPNGTGVQPIRHIHELKDALERIYKLGVRQAGRLRKAFVRAYEDCGIDPHRFIPEPPEKCPSFSNVRRILEQDETDNEGLLNRLSPLIDFGFFPDNEAIRFREMLGRSVVLQLHDLPNDRIKQALSEFVIMRLHTLLLRGEQPRALRRMLVFDEAWRVSKNQHLVELGREGRAFGVGLVVSSQFPADVPESLRGNLATKVYLANTDARHRSLVARQLGLLPEDPMLVGLARHEGFVQSSQFSPPCRVRTKPYFERS